MYASYECMVSENQKLTFAGTEAALKAYGSPIRLDDLQIRNDAGKYNNFALMLSDQYAHGYTVVSSHYGTVYEGQGSMLEQIRRVNIVLDSMNTRRIVKGHTTAVRKFPRSGVQECITNAAVHSDMSQNRKICVEVGDRMMVISSPGMPCNITDTTQWLSPKPRNRMMGNLLKELKMASMNFSGLYQMERSYKQTCLQPYIIRKETQFTVFLPAYMEERRNYQYAKTDVMRYLNKSHGATVDNVCIQLDATPYFVKRLLDRMEDEGEIFGMGKPGKKTYFPCNVNRRGCWDADRMDRENGPGAGLDMLGGQTPRRQSAV